MIVRFLKHLGQQRKGIALSIVAAALSAGSVLPMAASAASPSKPVPTRPATAQTTLEGPSAAKTQAGVHSLAPQLAYTTSISASPSSLWPTQYTTLTAVTNQDVGPTPYYLSVYDVTAGSYVKICGSGTMCTVSVTQATATTHTYRSYVSTYPLYSPVTVQAVSANINVTWMSLGTLTLAASPTTLGLNGTTTLTAVSTVNVTPTPFYIEIFDVTTGTRLISCPFGTVCSTTTSQAIATTHKFVAYTSSNTAPATNIQATSNVSYATWSANNYRVSLAATPSTTLGRVNLVATSNVNVGPTPYYIEIFNARTGAFITACGSGTTCTAYNVALAFGRNDFVAFTSSYGSSVLPPNVQASSNVVTRNWNLVIIP